jgi:hypothetical protein
MAQTPQDTPPIKDWRFALAIGLSLFLALAASAEVKSALEPSLGGWGAALISWVVAAVVGALVWVVIHWLQRRGGSGRP